MFNLKTGAALLEDFFNRGLNDGHFELLIISKIKLWSITCVYLYLSMLTLWNDEVKWFTFTEVISLKICSQNILVLTDKLPNKSRFRISTNFNHIIISVGIKLEGVFFSSSFKIGMLAMLYRLLIYPNNVVVLFPAEGDGWAETGHFFYSLFSSNVGWVYNFIKSSLSFKLFFKLLFSLKNRPAGGSICAFSLRIQTHFPILPYLFWVGYLFKVDCILLKKICLLKSGNFL